MSRVRAAILLLAAASSCAVPAGNHTCTGLTKIPVTVLVNVTVPVTFRSYTWCLRVPPRCSKYTVQLRDRVQLHTEMHNKTITVCCRGYVEMEGRCVPACPEGADCPFMHCNRTNHCHCTPGYTGLYCNDPCPRGVWGKDCKRPCDCPTGYTCHHLTGDCMVDDRPSRKSTTVAPTTTTVATTTLLTTTEATTMETVKTPQFRFPPPPWVEAAGSTTPKKQTTRIIRDELTTPTTQVKWEQVTTPETSVLKTIRPILMEFFTPPKESSTIQSTTTVTTIEPTTMYITEKKEEYLPISTQATTPSTTVPTTIPTTVTTIPTTVTTIPTTVTTVPTTITTQSTTTVKLTTPSTTTTEVITTPTTTTTTQPTTVTTLSTTPSTVTVSTTETTIPSTVTTKLTTPSTVTTSTTINEEPTSSSTVTTLTTIQTTPPTTVPTTITIETIKVTEAPLDAPIFVVKTIPPIESTTVIDTTSTSQEVTYQKEKSSISPEFKVIKVIKTENSQPKPQKFPTTKKEQTPLELDNNPSLGNQFDSKEPTITNIKSNVPPRTKVKEDRSPIIYISPTSKDIHEIMTTNKVPISKTPSTTIHVPFTPIVTTLKKDDGNTVENEIELKETTLETTTVTPQHNKSLLHSLFSEPKVPVPTDKQSSDNEEEPQMKGMHLSPEVHSTLTSTQTEETKLTTILNKKKTKEYLQKKNEDKPETKLPKKVTMEGPLITLSPIHLLKQLLNATSKPRTTTTILPSSENLPPSAYIDDFTKEILNKKSKYDDLIIPFSLSEKGKKKHEKTKQRHSKEGKEHSFATPFKPEKQPDISVPTLTSTSTVGMAEKITVTTSEIVTTTTTKPTEQAVSVISNIKPLETTHSPNQIYLEAHTTKVKEYIRNENEKILTTENQIGVTDNNNIVESNTINSLHTSMEGAGKKGLEEEQEDSNYSIMHNKMKLVKTETQYGAAGMTGRIPRSNSVTGVLMSVGIGCLTLVALAGTIWVYMRRKQGGRSVGHPPIMAYQLPEPTPIDVQSLEQTFFCPTFTNNYAAKINRELRELSYDHPRMSPPEPLYAEIRY